MSEAILPTSCPKPAQREKAAKRNGIQRKTPMQRSKPKPMGAMPQRQSKPRKPLAKVGKQKAKRIAKNREYYASPEWRAKKKAVHERDEFQCTERFTLARAEYFRLAVDGHAGRIEAIDGGRIVMRCPNRGEWVRGKQTAKGLVAEEVSYSHRGVEGRIDCIRTRCASCDRHLTPRERINHAYGFSAASHVPAREGVEG